MSKIHIYYLPTYLVDKPPKEPKATLLIRKYQKYKAGNGTWVTKYNSDAIYYENEEAMVADIKEKGMRELPQEAETDPTYIPPRHRSNLTRRATRL